MAGSHIPVDFVAHVSISLVDELTVYSVIGGVKNFFTIEVNILLTYNHHMTSKESVTKRINDYGQANLRKSLGVSKQVVGLWTKNGNVPPNWLARASKVMGCKPRELTSDKHVYEAVK